MTILVLGGTREGKQIAEQLYKQGLPVIYSIAGLVRIPALPCPVISGGFRQFGGLATYLHQQGIMAVIDATHPFAQQMTFTAIEVTHQFGIGYWRFQRPAWQAGDEDHWYDCRDWQAVIGHCQSGSNIFLSCGQLTFDQLQQLPSHANYLYRTAVSLTQSIPAHIRWQQGIGPFDFQQELALLIHHSIDMLVTKNSGGEFTAAKLLAARHLGLPVLMLSRPELGIMARLSVEPLYSESTSATRASAKTDVPARLVSDLEVCLQELQQYYSLCH